MATTTTTSIARVHRAEPRSPSIIPSPTTVVMMLGRRGVMRPQGLVLAGTVIRYIAVLYLREDMKSRWIRRGFPSFTAG